MFFLYKKVVFYSLLVVLLVPLAVFASPREDAIKSGFLYNFARYSQGDWFNADIEVSYVICSFDESFIEVAEVSLKDLQVKERPVVIKLLLVNDTYIGDCNSIFFSKDDIDKWTALSAKNSSEKMMLVGDFEGFIELGGHINFYNVGGKIRFEIDPEKLVNSGINMSSKVLRLGKIYKAGY